MLMELSKIFLWKDIILTSVGSSIPKQLLLNQVLPLWEYFPIIKLVKLLITPLLSHHLFNHVMTEQANIWKL